MKTGDIKQPAGLCTTNASWTICRNAKVSVSGAAAFSAFWAHQAQAPRSLHARRHKMADLSLDHCLAARIALISADFSNPNSLKQPQKISARVCQRRGARAQFLLRAMRPVAALLFGKYRLRVFGPGVCEAAKSPNIRSTEATLRPRGLEWLSSGELRQKRNRPMPAPRLSQDKTAHESPPSVL